MTKTDLIIIGSGPGGYRAACYAARHGLSVVVAEAAEAGGTCLNCGCIPTKALCRNAEIADLMSRGEEFGIDDLHGKIDFSKVMERKSRIVNQLREGVQQLMSMPGITFIRGFARLKNRHEVVIDGKEYEADNIIIATGSRPKTLAVAGIDLPGVMNSTELLEADNLPKRLCIIGAGVIGMEFASIFRSLGSEVTVLEYLKEAVPSLDSDIAKRLRQTISRHGVEFIMQAAVKSVRQSDNCDNGLLTVTFERKGKETNVNSDIVLVATGRVPNVENIGLDSVGIEYENAGITVDDNFMTNIDGIYAIGDVNGRCLLAHAATFQGIHAVNHILGKDDHIDFNVMPAAIFTNPEAACVGLSEDQCKELGVSYSCKKGFFRANGKAMAMGETDGMLKLLIDENGKIIGCHAFGAHSSDIVQEVAVLMNRGAGVTELHDIIHIHPTLSEVLHDAVDN